MFCRNSKKPTFDISSATTSHIYPVPVWQQHPGGTRDRPQADCSFRILRPKLVQARADFCWKDWRVHIWSHHQCWLQQVSGLPHLVPVWSWSRLMTWTSGGSPPPGWWGTQSMSLTMRCSSVCLRAPPGCGWCHSPRHQPACSGQPSAGTQKPT